MITGDTIYIIVIQICDMEIDIGYLPFERIPAESILWKAMREDRVINYMDAGIQGIHHDYDLAMEHLVIEKAYRTNVTVTLHTIRVNILQLESGIRDE